MATSASPKSPSDGELQPSNKSTETMECAICLNTCHLPVELPCSHVFCFLCIKGIAMQGQGCALCRKPIPKTLLEKPEKLFVDTLDDTATTTDADMADEGSTDSPASRFVWFYEGRNGWWQYDARTSRDIEYAYLNNDKTIDVLIAGNIYVIDLESRLQSRKSQPGKKRRIKRDVRGATIKGIAGLRNFATPVPEADGGGDDRSSNASKDDGDGLATLDLTGDTTDTDDDISLRDITLNSPA